MIMNFLKLIVNICNKMLLWKTTCKLYLLVSALEEKELFYLLA